MLILNRRQKIYLALGILILISTAFVFFFLWPTFQEISRLKKEIEVEKQTINDLQNKEEEIKKLTRKENEIKVKEDLAVLEKALTKEDDPLNFILTTEEIAKKNNVKQNINLEDKKEKDKMTEKKEGLPEDKLKDLPSLAGQITLEGKFKNLFSYLVYFERIVPLAEVTGLEINTGEAKQIKSNIKEEAKTIKELKAILNIRVFTE